MTQSDIMTSAVPLLYMCVQNGWQVDLVQALSQQHMTFGPFPVLFSQFPLQNRCAYGGLALKLRPIGHDVVSATCGRCDIAASSCHDPGIIRSIIREAAAAAAADAFGDVVALRPSSRSPRPMRGPTRCKFLR